jgi:DNA repair exonuclease SbcCD ATPase subunit
VAGTSRLPLVADSENIQPAVASDASSHVHTAPHALSNTSTFDSTVTQKEDNTGLIRRKAQHVPPTPASAAEQSSIQQHRESAEQTLDQQTAVESISDTRSVHHAGPANIMHQTTSHTVHPNGAVNQLQQTLQEHDSTITADNQDDLYSAEPGIAQPGINDIMDALLSRFQQEELLRSQEEDKKLKWQEQAMREQAKQEDLRTQLSTLQQETEEAKAAVQQQKTKIAKSETKVTKLRSFITGLGNDMESLKKKANADRQDSEQVFNAQGERQAELEGLLTEMSSRVGKSTQLQNEAMKLCRESKAELTAAILRSTHLEKQLEAKSRQLVEEKEHREQIQSQLASVTTSHEAMNRELVSSRDTVLDKLGEIEIILDESDNREKVADMIDKTFQAVKGGNAQQASALDDILSLKGMVENLSESYVCYCCEPWRR